MNPDFLLGRAPNRAFFFSSNRIVSNRQFRKRES